MRAFAPLMLALVMGLGACTHTSAPKTTELPPPVVASKPSAASAPVLLVSIDGFRADYLNRGITPTLSALAAKGAVAPQGMRSAFPSVTFPNHYTLVTGLVPDHHGLVNNSMTDPAIPGVRFTLSNREVAADPRWWAGGEPIWVTLEKANIRTATMFWPGSEVEIRGARPSNWLKFDQTLPGNARVDQLLAWMDAPAETRAQFFTLYFDIVDTQGHEYGPDSAELNAAVADVDASLARLMEGLKTRGLADKINIVVVADHGMAEVSDARSVDLDKLIDPTKANMVWDNKAFAGFDPTAENVALVEKALLGKHEHYECWRKAEMPKRFVFGSNNRIPPIFCLAEPGWMIKSASRPSKYVSRGAHGFDPADPTMAALFLAAGPNIKPGTQVPSFDNVDVYPLVMKLLGVPAQANDGDLNELGAVIK